MNFFEAPRWGLRYNGFKIIRKLKKYEQIMNFKTYDWTRNTTCLNGVYQAIPIQLYTKEFIVDTSMDRTYHNIDTYLNIVLK